MATADVYFHPIFLEHDTGDHPECAERLVVARRRLLQSGMGIEWIEPTPAEVEAVARVHDSAYIRAVHRMADAGGGSLDPDTVVSPLSYSAAMYAAGAGIQAVERALHGGRRSFLLVRPPGHHARREWAMGFCLFNNVAIAAAHALEELGVERVLIVDWDVHHGNGTQEAFYDDPRVLYCSFHLGRHFPGTGSMDEIGVGRGLGYTANLPLMHGAGDGAASAFFSSVIGPLAEAFDPQLVLVSAGYDSGEGDPLGGLRLTREAFRWMSGTLGGMCARSGAAGPVCFLEGGYDTDVLASGIEATIEGLIEGPGEMSAQPTGAEAAAVETLTRRLSAHWAGVLT
ncbi:MAG TPA: histone deacetylase [Thermoleophilia bacterium]|nr:histone deacetylase [Thermoleophilia bacterium]